MSGCHLVTELHSDMYVGGIELYNPDRFSVGSSLSHTDRPGLLFMVSLLASAFILTMQV